MRRFSFLHTFGVAAIAAAPFLCLLSGCSGIAVTKQPTKSLDPHYIASAPPPAFDINHPVQGHAWRNSDGTLATTITYHFEKGNGSDAQRKAAIKGLGQWNREPPPTPDFQRVPDDAPAAVVVRFVDSGEGKQLPPGVQGSCSWFPASAPTTAIILLNRGILNPSELASDALHEAGHANFSGDDNPSDQYDRDHSPWPGDAMYYRIQPYVSTLTTRDANSAARSYGKAPSRLEPSSVPQVWARVDCKFEETGEP
jgi:hypothetical protein